MATTCTITATIVDPSQTGLLGNAFVRFRLRNFQGFVRCRGVADGSYRVERSVRVEVVVSGTQDAALVPKFTSIEGVDWGDSSVAGDHLRDRSHTARHCVNLRLTENAGTRDYRHEPLKVPKPETHECVAQETCLRGIYDRRGDDTGRRHSYLYSTFGGAPGCSAVLCRCV